MNPLNKRSVTCVFGAGDSGKTGLVIKYLLNAKNVSCRFIFDPDEEFSERLKLKPARTPYEMEVGIRQGYLLFDPSELYGGDTEAALLAFCDLALTFSASLPGRKLIVIDEVWRHINPRVVPPELLAVVKTGRKVGLQSVFITHEPREINETLLAEGTEFISFRLAGLNSLGKLEDYGFPMQEKLPTLPAGQFIAWNTKSGGVLEGKLF